MANKMLIDATHPEETRVVVLRGNRVEEFDFESAHRKQLRGNIYLAKVTRVEPSLQAAFVDYGGNRHGFLAFSEIHPDYYQIPVADRQALIDEEERAQRAADDEADRRSRRHRHHGGHSAGRRDAVMRSEPAESADGRIGKPGPGSAATSRDTMRLMRSSSVRKGEMLAGTAAATASEGESAESAPDIVEIPGDAALGSDAEPDEAPTERWRGGDDGRRCRDAHVETEHLDTEPNEAGQNAHALTAENGEDEEAAEEIVESVGGADAMEEVPDRASALPPPVQNPRGHQAPASHAGAGGQGRARHQGRGADDLSVARRPLFGADAQHRARRRHQPQDHQFAKIARG